MKKWLSGLFSSQTEQTKPESQEQARACFRAALAAQNVVGFNIEVSVKDAKRASEVEAFDK